jgi:hypothetical protein
MKTITVPQGRFRYLPVGVKMVKIRSNILSYLKIIAIIGILIAFIPFPNSNNSKEQDSGANDTIAISNLTSHPFSNQNKPIYDYSQMLNLIEQCRQIRNDFHNAKFKPNKIDIKMINSIIAELKYERSAIRDHIDALQIYYNRSIPAKKARALRYYKYTLKAHIKVLNNIQAIRAKRFSESPF